jgi:glycosyltransferase involved in cell wall biosynthesis
LFYSNIRYLIVGRVAEHYDLGQEIEARNLQDIVSIKGHTSTEEFHRLMNRADIIINLRYPSAREMSATLLRAMALGKPVLMSRLKHLMEIPEDAAIKIRPENEQQELFHHLWQLIEDPKLRATIGNKARTYLQTYHRPEQMIGKYLELLETALERKKTFQPLALPAHLSNGRTMIRHYIRKTAFAGKNSSLLELLPE